MEDTRPRISRQPLPLEPCALLQGQWTAARLAEARAWEGLQRELQEARGARERVQH